jgi:hypothetical protein
MIISIAIQAGTIVSSLPSVQIESIRYTILLLNHNLFLSHSIVKSLSSHALSKVSVSVGSPNVHLDLLIRLQRTYLPAFTLQAELVCRGQFTARSLRQGGSRKLRCSRSLSYLYIITLFTLHQGLSTVYCSSENYE